MDKPSLKRMLPIWTAFLCLVASGCEKNRRQNFPNTQFEEYIYLNNPTSLPLQTIGGVITHPGGYRGLLVYRRYQNRAEGDFAAYDRGCPQHFAQDCGQLEISADQSYAECPCEGERYLLFDGSPADKARLPLISYPTSFDGSILYITNR